LEVHIGTLAEDTKCVNKELIMFELSW